MPPRKMDMTDRDPLDALIERLRKLRVDTIATDVPIEQECRDFGYGVLALFDEIIEHLSAGATPAAQDTKPLEALKRLENWIICTDPKPADTAALDADLALISAALVRAEESEQDAARMLSVGLVQKLDATLRFYADTDTYLGERTGGVVQGCPRGTPAIHRDMGKRANALYLEIRAHFDAARTAHKGDDNG